MCLVILGLICWLVVRIHNFRGKFCAILTSKGLLVQINSVSSNIADERQKKTIKTIFQKHSNEKSGTEVVKTMKLGL